MILAMIGHEPTRRPFLKGLARIDRQGVLHCKLYPAGLLLPRVVPLCRIEDWIDELRRLCDTIKADEREAEEIFTEARKWIERDERAQSGIN